MIYHVPNIALWFHNFPHFYQLSNVTFDPQNYDYIRSLIILAALPLVFLLVALLFFLCYFLLRRITEPTRKKNLFPLNIANFVFLIILCALVAFGLYGNNSVSEGIESLTQALESFDETLKSIIKEVVFIYDLVNKNIKDVLSDLRNEISFLPNATTVISAKLILDNINKDMNSVDNNMKIIDNTSLSMHSVNLTEITNVINYADYIRWSLSVGFLCLAFLVFLLITCGIGKKSSHCLKTGGFFGVLCLIIFWICLGLYLAISVGIGDFCVNPNGYIMRLIQPKQKVYIKYYLECDENNENPVSKFIKESQSNVANSYSLTSTVIVPLGRSFPNTSIGDDANKLLQLLNQTTISLDYLFSLTDCHLINKEYNNALTGVCIWSLYGMAYLILSFLVSVVVLFIIIMLSSRTWVHYYRPTRRQYVEIDEQDPFLPPTSSTMDSYGSFGYKLGEETVTYPNSIYADFLISTNSHVSQNNTNSSLSGRSPPPAYASFENSNLSTSQGTRARISSPFTGPDF